MPKAYLDFCLSSRADFLSLRLASILLLLRLRFSPILFCCFAFLTHLTISISLWQTKWPIHLTKWSLPYIIKSLQFFMSCGRKESPRNLRFGLVKCPGKNENWKERYVFTILLLPIPRLRFLPIPLPLWRSYPFFTSLKSWMSYLSLGKF